MSIFSRLSDAWGALCGDSQGYIPIAGSPLISPNNGSGDDPWMRISAYFACIRNISEDIAKLPLITYKRLGRGKERAPDHIYSRLLKTQPYPSVGSMAFRETITRFALGWGNGFAKICRRANGKAHALQIMHPLYVKIKKADNGHVDYIYNHAGKEEIISDTDMIHIHGLSFDGVNGISIAAQARNTLEFANSTQEYGNNLYTRGGRPGGILVHPGKLAEPAKEKLKDTWNDAYSGKNSGKTAVLDGGMEYKPFTISPIDAQYLETRQFSVEEIARWFRMPLHKIQYLVRAQGWSTLDAMNTDYLTDTLLPWLTRWEEEINRKLFCDDKEYFAEHLVNALLRGDQTARTNFYSSQFAIGALSINEIRSFENMNPIANADGDKHYVPLNYGAVGEEKTDDTQS